MTPLITVITPVFNGARFIEQCIKNVAMQACENIEHLIVDGGSSDETVDIIKRNAQHLAHIQWISEPDDGQADAMNKGVRLARGRVIGILNVDDYYEPGVLRRIQDLFTTKLTREPSLAVGNCQVWDNDHNPFFLNKPSRLHITDLMQGQNYAPFPVNPSAYFYHKSLHKKAGDYDVNHHYALDLDFILRAVQVARLHYFDELWGNYRHLVGTKTHQDMAAGTAIARGNAVYDYYRSRLTWWQVLQIKIKQKQRRIVRKRMAKRLSPQSIESETRPAL